MGSSDNLRIPWICEQPLFLDMKLMGKLRPSGMKQFAPNQNCGTKSHMKTPPGPPSAPRRDEINLNPSLDTTQACASKPSPLIPNPSSPSAPDGCVGYFPSTSHALALAKPRLSAKLGFFFHGTGAVTLQLGLFANLKAGCEEIPGLPWVCFPGAKLMSHFPV